MHTRKNRYKKKAAMKSNAPRGIPEDRISSLPNSILCHILSFLPTKFAAATSILSTRWQYIFLSVPRIDLDDSLLLKPRKKQDEERGRKAKLLEYFVIFVNRLLLLSKLTCVTEFRLKFQKPVRYIVFKTWISAILLRDVQVLDIRVENFEDVSLPCEILTCKTLVVLKLHGGVFLQFPKSVSLPNLKVLHLEEVHLAGSDAGWTFSSDFPLLEDLHLQGINLYGIEFIDICLRSLTRLSWVFVNWCSDELADESKVVIDTPNVKDLEYDCCVIPNRSICNLDSLVTADLSCYTTPHATLSHFLSKMVNVKSLRLHGFTLEYLIRNILEGNCLVPNFPNLAHLELNPEHDNELKLIATLLQHAPKLEKLVCDMDHCCGEGLEYPAQETVPQCLAQHLREVEIKSFRGRKQEFEVVRYLLLHGAVLEVMSMTMYPSKDEISNGRPSLICKKLLKFSRCSKKCEIVLKLRKTQ